MNGIMLNVMVPLLQQEINESLFRFKPHLLLQNTELILPEV